MGNLKVLGTFITEWDEGKATCKEMLATKESAQMYAERLAELATALGFDGWLVSFVVVVHLHLSMWMTLTFMHMKHTSQVGWRKGYIFFYLQINIENEIDEEQIPNLKEFVSHLTKVLRLSAPGALVIWWVVQKFFFVKSFVLFVNHFDLKPFFL